MTRPIPHPSIGMTKYCSPTPAKIALGATSIRAKSRHSSVSPIPSMMIPSPQWIDETPNHEKVDGQSKDSTAVKTDHTGNHSVANFTILLDIPDRTCEEPEIPQGTKFTS